MNQLNIAIVLLVVLPACSTTKEIIIDRKGVDMGQYYADLEECRGYSAEVKTKEKGAKGAVSGAVVGGAVGAIFDGAEGAARGAGVGAVTGGAEGINKGEGEEVEVVKRCLSGRGYQVLN
ncbi:MAG: glycine zipper family protein [Gammaproteobacteria bacterium]